MLDVVVGVILTAVLGGLLVPTITTHLTRRREQFNVSRELFETLAGNLWTYWKLAMRIAYYGRKSHDSHDDYICALQAWDSPEAWDNGGQIQIQISRSKRLLPETHNALDDAQRTVVDDLDKQVECLRNKADATEWGRYYKDLYGPTRRDIQDLLFSLDQQLRFAARARLVRWWCRLRGKAPKPFPVKNSQRRSTAA